jgi:hypothetical protein
MCVTAAAAAAAGAVETAREGPLLTSQLAVQVACMHSQAERAAAAAVRCVNIAPLPPLQAQRLSWHPSLVMWAGNNENEQALEWFQESWNNPEVSLPAQNHPGPLLNFLPHSVQQCHSYCAQSQHSDKYGVEGSDMHRCIS